MSVTQIILAIILIILALIILAVVIKKIKRRGSVKNSDAGEGNEQIYVGNLPYRTSEKDLRKFFEKFGQISSIRVIRDQATGRSRGFAFITYCSAAEADKSLVAHGQDLYGRQMVVRIAKTR